MNYSGRQSTRKYEQTARAEQAAETGERILDAALERFASLEFDEVTLSAVAAAAGVTKQTVINRFGGKEGLFSALVEREAPRIEAERRPPQGNSASMEEALRALVDHYEKDGETILNLLRHEGRSEQAAAAVRHGREVHEKWVRTYCRAAIGDAGDPLLGRAVAAAVAATDLYVWKLLRVDRGLPREEAEEVMLVLLRGIAARFGRS